MARVRYGARTEAEIAAARTASSRLPDIWSTGVVAVWESDPDAVAAVLPPPLKPTGRPLVRVNISKVDLPGYPLGAGSFAVAAAHDGVDGLVSAGHADDPRAGPHRRPRGLRGAQEARRGDASSATASSSTPSLARHGIAFVEVRGAVSERTAAAGADAEDRLLLQVPARGGRFGLRRRPGARALPAQREGPPSWSASPGTSSCASPCTTRSPTCRCARLVEHHHRREDQRPARQGRRTGRAREALLPYIHQRYDDPQQILDGPPEGSA